MVQIMIEVVYYKASKQEFHHWVLYFEGPGESIFFITSPEERTGGLSSTFWNSGHVSAALANPKSAAATLAQVEVDDMTPFRNCQYWVMVALEYIKDRKLIPEYDHEGAVATLNELCGPNDKVRQRIVDRKVLGNSSYSNL
jgi:hypothetical protein